MTAKFIVVLRQAGRIKGRIGPFDFETAKDQAQPFADMAAPGVKVTVEPLTGSKTPRESYANPKGFDLDRWVRKGNHEERWTQKGIFSLEKDDHVPLGMTKKRHRRWVLYFRIPPFGKSEMLGRFASAAEAKQAADAANANPKRRNPRRRGNHDAPHYVGFTEDGRRWYTPAQSMSDVKMITRWFKHLNKKRISTTSKEPKGGIRLGHVPQPSAIPDLIAADAKADALRNPGRRRAGKGRAQTAMDLGIADSQRPRGPGRSPRGGGTSTATEVRSPTSTSTEVRSPTSTSTSTDAFTADNVTVTGGAGAGDTSVSIYTSGRGKSSGGGRGAPSTGRGRLQGGTVRQNPDHPKVLAYSKERYNGGIAVKRQWGSSTVTIFYVMFKGDEKNASKWVEVKGFGKTPGERKTYAMEKALPLLLAGQSGSFVNKPYTSASGWK